MSFAMLDGSGRDKVAPQVQADHVQADHVQEDHVQEDQH